MSTLNELKMECTKHDQESERIGYQKYIESFGSDIEDLMYVAEQRALRALLIFSKRPIPKGGYKEIKLTIEENKLLSMFSSVFLDGFIIGNRLDKSN